MDGYTPVSSDLWPDWRPQWLLLGILWCIVVIRMLLRVTLFLVYFRLWRGAVFCSFLFLANGCFSDWVLFCCVYAWYTLKVLNNPARVIKCVAWKWRSCFNTPDVSTVIFSRQTGNSLMLFPFYTESPISSAVSIERGSIEFRVQNDVCWCVYQTIVFCIDSRSGSRFAVSIFQSVVRQSGLILRHC